MFFPFSVRSPQWLRSKWWALKKHVPDSDTTTFQGMFFPSFGWYQYQMCTFDGTFTVQCNVQCGQQCTTKSGCIWGLTLREKKWEAWCPYGSNVFTSGSSDHTCCLSCGWVIVFCSWARYLTLTVPLSNDMDHFALHSRSSGLGSSPGREHCVVFLGKTLSSHSASLHPGV